MEAVTYLCAVLFGDHVAIRRFGRRGSHELSRGRADGHVVGRRLQNLVALLGKECVELIVRHGRVALVHLALDAHVLHLPRRH